MTGWEYIHGEGDDPIRVNTRKLMWLKKAYGVTLRPSYLSSRDGTNN